MTQNRKLLNHIEEYFQDSFNPESTFKDLFEANKSNVDLRTDLSIQEIVVINKLLIDDEFIKKRLKFSLFSSFLDHYLRLKISKNRESRKEFVDINKRDRFKEHLKDFGNFQNLMEVKK
jgi:hypothetical protein